MFCTFYVAYTQNALLLILLHPFLATKNIWSHKKANVNLQTLQPTKSSNSPTNYITSHDISQLKWNKYNNSKYLFLTVNILLVSNSIVQHSMNTVM